MIKCQDPDVGANSTVNITTKDYGGSAKYTCAPGYAITKGDSIRYCYSDGKGNSSDLLTGEWTGEAPVCTGTCNALN